MDEQPLHILVVEDNPTDTFLLRKALGEIQTSTVTLTQSNRLDEALKYLDSQTFDVVLLDLGLPDSQGIESFGRMQELHSGTPILILSGLEDEQLAVQAVKDGAQDFLVKGRINGTMLFRSIRYAIERKLSEQRLIASEAGYRRLFETAHDGIFILDAATGQISDANPYLEEMLGYAMGELHGKRLWEIAAFRDKAASQAAFDTLRGKGYILYKDLPLATKDGRCINVEFVSNIYEVGNKRVIQCNIRDITERKNAEAAELASKRFLQSTLDALSSHIAVIDASGKIIAVNQAWQGFSEVNNGNSVSCGIGANYIDICQQAKGSRAEEALSVARAIRKILDGSQQAFSLEYPCHSTTEQRWFNVCVTPFIGAGQVCVVVAHENITERLLAQQGLQKSEQDQRQLAEHLNAEKERLAEAQSVASVGSWELDFSSHKLVWSDENYRIFGTDRNEFGGSYDAFLQFVYPDDRKKVDKAFTESVANQQPYSIDHRLQMKDGTIKFVHERCRTFYDDQGRPLRSTGTTQDITNRKEAEEERDRFFTLSLDMLGIVGLDGYLKRVNPAFIETLGYTEDELMSRPFREMVHPDDQSITQAAAIGLSQGIALNNLINRYPTRDGGWRWLEWRSVSAPEWGVVYAAARDITQRKDAEAALIESEERFRQMAESVDEVFWLLDPVEGKLLYVSPSFEKVWGFPCHDLLNQSINFIDTVHPDDHARMVAAQEHQSDPGGFNEEYRIVRPDGSVRWIWSRTFPIYDEKGDVYRIAGITQNIDARKEVEAALYEANNILELRVEERTAELQQANAETRVRARQQEAVAQLGQRALTNIDIDTLLTGATALVTATLDVDISSVLELTPSGSSLRICAGTGWRADSINHEVSAQADSQAGYALMSKTPVIVTDLRSEKRFKPSQLLLKEDIVSGITVIVGSHNQPFGTLGAHKRQQHDFTQDDIHFLQAIANVLAAALEQRRAEEALYKNHEFLEAVLENTAEGIVACDADGQLTFFNRATRDFHGLPAESLPSEQWAQHYSLCLPDGISPMRQEDVPLFKALRGEHIRNMEMIIVPRQGSPRLVLNNGATLFDVAGKKLGAVVVMHDITESRKVEVELQRANRAKSDFLSRMSHELRTPLNAILGFGQILERQQITPIAKESVGYILKGGRHLLGLINEVLDIARVEAGHVDFSPEPIALAAVVPEVCALMGPLAAERSIRLHENASELKNIYVLADLQRLKQVFINLMSNSIKYNQENGEVEVACSQKTNGWISIAIRDTGPGITPDDLPKLFTAFERLGAANSEVEGTGLGLVLSQRLITAMGGILSVESTVGRGTIFTVELPQTASPKEQLTDSSEGIRAMDTDKGTGQRIEYNYTVLCIEDNPSNLRLFEVIFQGRPEIILMTAMQGSVGLDLARQHEPNLILLDLDLPDIKGNEVLIRLQQSAITRDIPVVVISADATPNQIERLLASGAKSYLTKPLDVGLFLQTIDQFLELTPVLNLQVTDNGEAD